MKKLSIILIVTSMLVASTTGGCAWPYGKANDSTTTQPRNSIWSYTGDATGVDPRAKAIENRLGYE